MGGKLPLSDNLAGVNSFPGNDITWTPGNQITNPMVNLGCLTATSTNDLSIINLRQPLSNIPTNISSGNRNTTQDVPQVDTPFTSTVHLTSNVDIYNISAIANNYSSITLSQEGLLWTLWPLAKPSKDITPPNDYTYFDNFTFGTAKVSNYPIGQLGYFLQPALIGCTPFGSESFYPTPHINYGSDMVAGSSLSDDSFAMFPGVQGFEESLTYNTGQQVAITVIKVSEQVARIFNPIAGVGADNRYIYVGYDGWALILTTTNPVGPMMAQTYITPQSRTGNVVENNYNVILPPNFPTTVYYKNQNYSVPLSV
jgi:hypothetical protein